MKIVKIILIVLVIGGIGTLGFFFYKEKQTTKNLKATVADNEEQIFALNAQIDSLSESLSNTTELVPVYMLTSDAKISAGNKLRMADVQKVDIPKNEKLISTLLTPENITEFIGKEFKVKVDSETILMQSMFRDSDQYNQQIFEIELHPSYLPLGLREGNLIQLRFAIPTGEEFVVLERKRAEQIVNDVVKITVSEPELMLLSSADADLAEFSDVGVELRIIKYYEDNEDQVPYYPVRKNMYTLAELSPNVKDSTRLINDGVRTYLDYTLKAADSNNNKDKFKNAFIGNDAARMAAYQQDLQEEKNENNPDTISEEENLIKNAAVSDTPVGSSNNPFGLDIKE